MKQPNKIARKKEELFQPDVLWLKDYLPYRLGVVATRMLREAGRIYKRFDDPLTTPEFRVIAILANFQPLGATEISKISMLDKVAVSRAVAQLTRRGFVTRSRTRQDQRILEVTLTSDGWSHYSKLIPLMRKQESALRAVINPTELNRLFGILDRYDAFFGALHDRHTPRKGASLKLVKGGRPRKRNAT
jgi:DNA-binding MarR family transcriptional regulator